MLYGEIIVVRSQIHTNTLRGKYVELLNVKLVVHIVPLGCKGLNLCYKNQSINVV